MTNSLQILEPSYLIDNFFTGGREGLIGEEVVLTSFLAIFGKIYPNKVLGNTKLMTKVMHSNVV